MKGSLIAFKILGHRGHADTNRLCRELYGYKDYSNMARYVYERKGLLDAIPTVKLIRSAFIVRKNDESKVIALLKKYKAKFHVREVLLTDSDLDKLGLKKS